MRIIITGTHFTPAVAVIEELKKIVNPQITYVGRMTTQEGDRTQSIESAVLPKLGIKFISLITGRLQRNFTFFTIISLLKIPIGFMQAFYIIFSEKPDVVLSFGGYVAVPIVFVSWLFSIPVIIHEQTLVPGLANKISSIFANKIALSFKRDNKFDSRIVLTGNPLRKKILNPDKNIPLEYKKLFINAKAEHLPVILVTGGNQGSHIINQNIEASLNRLTKIAFIIHITGNNKFNDFKKAENWRNDHYLVKKWIGDEYGAILSRVDLVIARAGINTLMELACLAKPALVIPIPYLYQDEQDKNASFFERLGLVQILPQSKLSAGLLFKNIKSLLNNLNYLKNKAKNAKVIIIPDAANILALETILLTKM